MKLIHSFGPNPRVVRMFMAEKGITLPSEEVDIMAGDNRKSPYLQRNPGGQSPALELDDGTIVAETAVICELLEEKHPTPSLIGKTAEERAHSRTWQRRVELNITENMYNGFRYAEGLQLFKDRMHCLPNAAADLKTIAQEKLAWLDGLMGDKRFICGSQIRFADITLYCCMDFAKDVGQPLNPALKNISAWYERVNARPSATSSLHPAWEQVKMRG
ncbi:MAG: glutathione S-transferase family protein [Gammaproteobacteria bacterium]|nr:glutathione S-transferase family protein [Gammaproteobacteria bacterium]